MAILPDGRIFKLSEPIIYTMRDISETRLTSTSPRAKDLVRAQRYTVAMAVAQRHPRTLVVLYQHLSSRGACTARLRCFTPVICSLILAFGAYLTSILASVLTLSPITPETVSVRPPSRDFPSRALAHLPTFGLQICDCVALDERNHTQRVCHKSRCPDIYVAIASRSPS